MQQTEQYKHTFPDDLNEADTLDSPATSQVVRVWAAVVVVVMLLNLSLSAWYLLASGDGSKFISHQFLTPLLVIGYSALGVLVVSKQPHNPIGWFMMVVSSCFGLSALAAGITLYSPALPSVLSPALLDFAGWIDNFIWLPAQILPITFVFLLFPDGRLLSPRWRVIGWSAGIGLILMMVALALHPGPLQDWATKPNPYGIEGAERAFRLALDLGTGLMAIGLAGSIAAVIIRFRRSRGIERQQMKWLAYAALIIILALAIMVPLWLLGVPESEMLAEISILSSNFVTLTIAAAASIAIARYRLYNIDVIINRTLVYSIMTGIVLLIYGLVVGGAGAVMQFQSNWLLTVIATGLVAALFQPVHHRLQRAVNRLLYGRRDEPFEVLSQLGQRLEQSVAPDSVYPTIVETLADALRFPYVALQERQANEYKTVESYGLPTNHLHPLPLVHQGDVIGRLLVGHRSPGEGLSEADHRLLRNIARQAGAAVHNAQLAAALQRSRQQIVASREEERLRLRRDLHDGLGPSLASLLLEARVVRRLIREDAAAAESLADEMQKDIRATIDDIRRVVQGLRPPALDDLGLVPAIRVMADKFGRSYSGGAEGLAIEVNAPDDLPSLPAAVEVAAFRIIQEALTNVIHHARARHALICLSMDRGLHIEICDDGVGFKGGREGGLGIHSMRERAAELGGRLRISRRPEGGTVVQAMIPTGED